MNAAQELQKKDKIKKRKKAEPKLIHIHAKCDFFEIHENVKEAQSVSRLNAIKNMFLWGSARFKGYSRLVVKTGVLNPTLF